MVLVHPTNSMMYKQNIYPINDAKIFENENPLWGQNYVGNLPRRFTPTGRPIAPGKRRSRKMFSDSEVANLVRGVEKYGEGK